MTAAPVTPAFTPLSEKDTRELRWVVLGHYLFAAFLALSGLACLLGLYPAKELIQKGQDGDWLLPPETIGWLIAALVITLAPLLIVHGALVWYTARCILRRRRRTLIWIMAVSNCLAVPVGTVLGLATLVVLGRPAVRAQFEAAPK